MAKVLRVQVQWASELKDSEFRLLDPIKNLAGGSMHPYVVISCGEITFSTEASKAVEGRADIGKLLNFTFPLRATTLCIKVMDRRGVQSVIRGDSLIGEAIHEIDLDVEYSSAQPSEVPLFRNKEQKGVLRLLVGMAGATSDSPRAAQGPYVEYEGLLVAGASEGYSLAGAPAAASDYNMPAAALNSGYNDLDNVATTSAASANANQSKVVARSAAAGDAFANAPVATSADNVPAAAPNSGHIFATSSVTSLSTCSSERFAQPPVRSELLRVLSPRRRDLDQRADIFESPTSGHPHQVTGSCQLGHV